ncbi:hypothetical protein [Staphylococcus felis]|nr:hypothetical protein [Staphylococcus felis]
MTIIHKDARVFNKTLAKRYNIIYHLYRESVRIEVGSIAKTIKRKN